MRRTVLSALALACGAVLASTAPAFADGASASPTRAPSAAPSSAPSATRAPTPVPSATTDPTRSASAAPTAEPTTAPSQVDVVPSGAPDTGVAPASKSSSDLTTGLIGGEPPRWSSAAVPSSSYGVGGRPGHDLALQACPRHRGDGFAARRLRRRARNHPGRELRSEAGEFGTLRAERRQDGACPRAFRPGHAAHPGHRGRHPGHRAGAGLGRHRAGAADHGARPGGLVPALADAGSDRAVGDPRACDRRHLRGRGLPPPRAAAQGDRIEALLENGTAATFTVTTVRTVAKADFPSDEVYGDVDRPELRLITCGGTRTGAGYLDNVIVFAALASASP